LTDIAALQFVERGLLTLDEPINRIIPEIDALQLISREPGDETFTLREPVNKMTLRHLLLNTCGLTDHDYPIIQEYINSDIPKPVFPEGTSALVTNFAIPLVFEPGEGFYYGYAIRFTQLLVARLAGEGGFLKYMDDYVFKPLGLESTSYLPGNVPEIWDRRMRMYAREDGKLVSRDEDTQGLTCSITDIAKIFIDVISPTSKLLKPENIDLLFTGQLTAGSAALKDLHGYDGNYSFVAGKPGTAPAVNWSIGSLLTEEAIPLSGLPKGTVTWDGWPNVLRAMNKEKGLAMFFATQLIPVGDEKAGELGRMFMRDAWKTFG
jgi:CubicO group peptidase (beta-lactamase class C family)